MLAIHKTVSTNNNQHNKLINNRNTMHDGTILTMHIFNTIENMIMKTMINNTTNTDRILGTTMAKRDEKKTDWKITK